MTQSPIYAQPLPESSAPQVGGAQAPPAEAGTMQVLPAPLAGSQLPSTREYTRIAAPVGHGRRTGPNITRSRVYRFVVDEFGEPVELGSGRSGKAFLGEEYWLESKTAFRRHVAIKVLQRGTTPEDALRFQIEKEVIERVQGHPNIVRLYASGDSENVSFLPEGLLETVENDYMIIELCDMSLEERLKGTRDGYRENLLAYPMLERLRRSLEYLLPVASAIEYAQLECNVSHRDIKPGNILLRLPNPRLQGSLLDVRLADFNVGKVRDDEQDLSLTRIHQVPGTQFFQSPEQETNAFELLVKVESGSLEVAYFEDFYINIARNDTFHLFNRETRYTVEHVDMAKRRIILDRPYEDRDEANVRAQILKSVDRPADIYSLGALFYYLISGACGNPKTLYDAFYKFIEYEGGPDGSEQNSVCAYIDHEYAVIEGLRVSAATPGEAGVAPADRFFSYKHFLDGNGQLIDREIMKVIARAMIRNKVDSFCQSWDIDTAGISVFVYELKRLYAAVGGLPGSFGGSALMGPAAPGAATKAWRAMKRVFTGGGGAAPPRRPAANSRHSKG